VDRSVEIELITRHVADCGLTRCPARFAAPTDTGLPACRGPRKDGTYPGSIGADCGGAQARSLGIYGHGAPAALSLPEAQRRRLPNRRRNETYDLVVSGGGTKVVATIGFDETGKPAEVFLNAGKVGSAINALLGDAAVVISVALQARLEHAADRGGEAGIGNSGPKGGPIEMTMEQRRERARRLIEAAFCEPWPKSDNRQPLWVGSSQLASGGRSMRGKITSG
jgi:hypothetical protein